MMRLTTDAVSAVLLAHDIIQWVTIPAECPDCLDGGALDWACPSCGNAQRNPLLDVAGAPCPTCNGRGEVAPANWLPGSDPDRCPSCLGSGGWTVTIATTTTPPTEGQQFGDWTAYNDSYGGWWIVNRTPEFTDADGDPTEFDVPLGVQVGTCTLAEPLPILDFADRTTPHHGPHVCIGALGDGSLSHVPHGFDIDISELLPYADWTPGRWAVRFSNLTPKDPT